YLACWANDYLSAGGHDATAVCDLFWSAAEHFCAGLAPGLPDSDYYRRIAVLDWNRRNGPHDSTKRDRHVRPRGGSIRGRRRALARQDRHDHIGKPPSHVAPLLP